MELLVQLWCPFEDSPMDRALYLWGCSRTGCQGKEGRYVFFLGFSRTVTYLTHLSVRAWRGLRYNEKYAAKISKKLARKRELDLAKAAAFEEEAKRKKLAAQSNPFAVCDSCGL